MASSFNKSFVYVCTGLQKILLHQRKRCEVVADAMVAVFTGTLEQKVNSPATESRLSPPSISHETLSQEVCGTAHLNNS